MNAKTRTQQLARTLRDAAIRNARATPELMEVVRLGGAFEDVLASIKAAQGIAGDPFAYGVTVLLNRLRVASVGQVDTASSWQDAPRSVVETLGLELGIGKWDEREQWPQYKARVTAADKQRYTGQAAAGAAGAAGAQTALERVA